MNPETPFDIFFPMAGQGARFGNRFKPFLTIDGGTFIEAAAAPFRRFLDKISRLIFVVLETQERDHDVTARLRNMFGSIPIEVVQLRAPTRGPADTIAQAVQQLSSAGPAFVCDCDHALDVAPLFERVSGGGSFDALLPVWPFDPDDLKSWSVAMVDDGHVRAIAEKRLPEDRRGTPMGVIGCYGFRDIVDTTERAKRLNAVNFSDVLGQLLAEGAVVDAVRISSARFFGDPDRLAKETGGSR